MGTPISFSGGWPPALSLGAGAAGPPAGARAAGAPHFEDVLLQSIEQVNDLDRQSQSMIAGALIGEEYTQAEVFTAVKKADLAFRTMLQIRNKLLDAYNEIKNMQM